MTRFGLLLAVAATAAMSAGGARAAPIEWKTPKTISGDADVVTAGKLIEASCASESVGGDDDKPEFPVVNGVKFTDSFPDKNVDMDFSEDYGPFGDGEQGTPWAKLSAAYRKLLDGGQFTDDEKATVKFSNLTVGRRYLIQIWVNDSRGGTREETVRSADGGKEVTLDFNVTDEVGGVGQFVVGAFVADATTQKIVFDGTESSQFNALQIRDITSEPAKNK